MASIWRWRREQRVDFRRAACPRAPRGRARSARSRRCRCWPRVIDRRALDPMAVPAPSCRRRATPAASAVDGRVPARCIDQREDSSSRRRGVDAANRCVGLHQRRLHRRAHQKRGNSGCGTAPACTCNRPNSAQRCSDGMPLSGFSRPVGIERALDAAKRAPAPAPRTGCTSALIFSMPTPCSPVIVPPSVDAQLQDLGTEVLGAPQLVGVVGVEQDQRMQVAVAGVEDVGAAQGCTWPPSPGWP